MTDFRLFWLGQTVSVVGSQVTALALPLVALLELGASPAEVGLLSATGYVPYLLFPLPVGVLVDRVRRRRLMIAADLVRAAALLLVPVGIGTDRLTVPALAAIAFAVGTATVVFDVSYQSVLPGLVGRDALPAANQALEASRAAASVLGPGGAGLLVSAVRASGAVVVDAVSFLVSAVSLAAIRRPEDRPAPDPTSRGAGALLAGARQVARSPVLRPQTAYLAASGLLSGAYGPVLVVFLVRELDLSGSAVGVTLAVANAGVVLGTLVSRRIAARIGIGRTLLAAGVLDGIGMLAVAASPGSAALGPVVLGQALIGLAVAVFNLQSVTLRQAVTPAELLGRVTAAVRLVGYGSVPVGAVLGGWLGGLLGLRAVVAALGVLTVAAAAILAGSGLRTLHTTPAVEPAWSGPT